MRRDADGRLALPTKEPTRHLSRLIEWAHRHGIDELPDLQAERPGLEEMYLELVHDADALEQAVSE